jgi:hypothetical protein
MQESARRVEASVPADVRDTPVQAANLGTGSDTAHANAEVARESANSAVISFSPAPRWCTWERRRPACRLVGVPPARARDAVVFSAGSRV